MLNLPIITLIPGVLMVTRSTDTAVAAAVSGQSERGTIFGSPYDEDWTKISAYVGLYSYNHIFDRMSPSAIKVGHGQYQFVNREGDIGVWPYLSFKRITQIDSQERATGRPGLLLTGTWNGRSYPLYWWWSSGFVCDGCTATMPSQYWKQMINVSSPAYMDYYVDEYIRGKMWNPQYQNYWIGVDEGAWYRDHFGIIDDNGIWHSSGVTYNSPTPQTQSDYVSMNIKFLDGVHARMPELKLMFNDGGAPNVADLQQIADHFDGVMEEDFYTFMKQPAACEGCSDYNASMLYLYLQNLWRMGDAGKPGIVVTRVDGSDQQSINAYALYLIARGRNFFFGLQTGDVEIFNAAQDQMSTRLGLPVAAATSQQLGSYPENRLFSRATQNGVVYVNFTGSTQIIHLPAGVTYIDRFGSQVTDLVLPDRSGGYVLRQVAPTPALSPSPAPTPPPSTPVAITTPSSFPDVPPSDPFYQAITQLAVRGIIRGYQDGTFGPTDSILRAQMAALIVRAVGWDAEDWGTPFPDQHGVDNDLWRNVGTLAHYSVSEGYTDSRGNYYDPLNNVINVQAISLISRAMVAKGIWQGQSDDPTLYPNVPASSGHRTDLATYFHYTKWSPNMNPHETWNEWDQPATRGWLAQALWMALQQK